MVFMCLLVIDFWLPCSLGKFASSALILRQHSIKCLVPGYDPTVGMFGASDGETKHTLSTEKLRMAQICWVLEVKKKLIIHFIESRIQFRSPDI